MEQIPEQEMIQTEEALQNAMPCLQTVLLNGWLLRFNKHYSYRSNCACPLYGCKNAKLQETTALCERLFAAQRLPSIIKVTPLQPPAFREFLLANGYQKVKTVLVMRAGLPVTPACERPMPSLDIRISETPDEHWITASVNFSGASSTGFAEVHRQNVTNLAVRHVFVSIWSAHEIIGCGYGAAERGLIGLYDLHVHPSFRQKGIGTAICQTIFQYGMEQNARTAYLIVHSQNEKAISLYTHLGLNPFYSYDFYQKAGSAYTILDL